MDDRNIIQIGTASFLMVISDVYQSLIPYLLLSIVFIIVDTRFGIAAARFRGTKIVYSRMWRRAITKFVDYLCWMTLAAIFGYTYGSVLGIPILTALVLLAVYGLELSSIFSNYFASKGIHKTFNVLKFLRKDLAEAIEDVNPENQRNEYDNK